MTAGISVILNAHREGAYLKPAVQSVLRAAAVARKEGICVELVLILDRPDSDTLRRARALSYAFDHQQIVDYGNLGASRSHGIALASFDWIAFMDCDDLVSSNWYLAAYESAIRHPDGRRRIWHTELFISFGARTFCRVGVRSDAAYFDPMNLITDWFFCNNLFCHKDIFDACPMTPYDHAAGYGSEDWHWSCETIAAGYHHDVVPETVYFYRLKDLNESLGAQAGLVHKYTELFSAEFVIDNLSISSFRKRLIDAQHVGSQVCHPSVISCEQTIPGYVDDEVKQQAECEPAVTDILQWLNSANGRPIALLPRMNSGVGIAYRQLIEQFDDRPKVGIWLDTSLIRGGMAAAIAICHTLSRRMPDHQPVLLLESMPMSNLFFERALRERFGCAIWNLGAIYSDYKVDSWTIGRLLIRPLIQFPFAGSIIFASRSFIEMFLQFPRATISNGGKILVGSLEPTVDVLSMEYRRTSAAAEIANASGWDVVLFSELYGELFKGVMPQLELSVSQSDSAAYEEWLAERWELRDEIEPPDLRGIAEVIRNREPVANKQRMIDQTQFIALPDDSCALRAIGPAPIRIGAPYSRNSRLSPLIGLLHLGGYCPSSLLEWLEKMSRNNPAKLSETVFVPQQTIRQNGTGEWCLSFWSWSNTAGQLLNAARSSIEERQCVGLMVILPISFLPIEPFETESQMWDCLVSAIQSGVSVEPIPEVVYVAQRANCLLQHQHNA